MFNNETKKKIQLKKTKKNTLSQSELTFQTHDSIMRLG
jgi:hypothetical protein